MTKFLKQKNIKIQMSFLHARLYYNKSGNCLEEYLLHHCYLYKPGRAGCEHVRWSSHAYKTRISDLIINPDNDALVLTNWLLEKLQ